jgi:two-component system response regulator NreC
LTPIRLLLVDDHAILRAGLRMLFAAEEDLEIVGEAESGSEALEAVQRLHPDVVIMDVAMPGMGGIEATRRIKEISPTTSVLALTMHEDEQYFFEMLSAGASGYIPKRAAPDDLIAAIHVVQQGNVFLHATLAGHLMRDLVGGAPAPNAPVATPESPLTEREREVLTLIAEGKTSREIAELLVVSPKTADRHRENIMAKLNLHSRVDLVKYAMARGLIPSPPQSP